MLYVVDAENVRRSLWPNLSPDELVSALARWAAREGVDALAVFDGPAPPAVEGIDVVGTGAETADDWITRHVTVLDEPYVLVTSDRELRGRAGANAAELRGGGQFVRELTRSDA